MTAPVPASDIVEINQLLAHYGHIVDAAEWDRFEELFLDDAVLDYTPANQPEVLYGVEAIRTFFSTVNHPSAHHCVNVYVYRHADGSVRVKSKFFVPHTRPTHPLHRWYGGDYDDIVEATAHGWRFRKRVCTGKWQLTVDPGTGEEIPVRRRTF